MVLVRLPELAVLLSFLLRHLQLVHIHQILIAYDFFLDYRRPISLLLPLLLFLFSAPLHLNRKQLARRPRRIIPPPLSPLLARANDIPLQRRGAAVKDKDGFDAVEEELADSAEESYHMAVPQGVSLFVSDGFEELVDPDGGVDGQSLAVQRLEFRRARAWLHDGPETGDTHGGLQ
jgi:hypothetical protein